MAKQISYTGANYKISTAGDIDAALGTTNVLLCTRPGDSQALVINKDGTDFTAQEETDLDSHMVTTNGLIKQ